MIAVDSLHSMPVTEGASVTGYSIILDSIALVHRTMFASTVVRGSVNRRKYVQAYAHELQRSSGTT